MMLLAGCCKLRAKFQSLLPAYFAFKHLSLGRWLRISSFDMVEPGVEFRYPRSCSRAYTMPSSEWSLIVSAGDTDTRLTTVIDPAWEE